MKLQGALNCIGIIDSTQDDLSTMIDRFLTARGWSLACDLPDNIWRYGKIFANRHVFVDKVSAYKLECGLCNIEANENEV